MRRVIKNTERVLKSFCVVLLGAVMLSQIFLLRPDTRPIFTNADRYEGQPGLQAANRQAKITLQTEQPEPGVFVLINGAKKQSFMNKIVTIQVPEHSLIQVSKEGVNHSVTVTVTELSDFVIRQNLNLQVSGEENIFLIGRILFQ